MKIFKVPLPANIFEFANSFPNTVPLIVSTKEGSSEKYGYWLFCDDKEEEEKIVKSLGLDYASYKSLEPMIASASSFPPIYDATKRAEEITRLTNSTLNSDKPLISLYQYAPYLQIPIICPKSLSKVDAGYKLNILKTDKKVYGQYDGFEGKAFEIGCRELRDALLQPGNPDIVERSIPDSEKPKTISDLSCVNGSPLVFPTFESLCNEARTGRAPDDLFTLNALIVKLRLNTTTNCETLKKLIEDYFSTQNNTNQNLEMQNLGLKSLKFFQYLPAISNVKVLKLNDNPRLGLTDNTSSAAIESLFSFIGLTNLNIKDTQIANLRSLRDLQFLESVEADWYNIFPETCELSTVASSLRTTCIKLQRPIALSLAGGTARFVATAAEIDFTLSASHEFAPTDNNIFSLSINKDRTSCEGLAVDGLHISGGTLPARSCVISVKVNGGRLIASTLDITINRLETCDGHIADTKWHETLTGPYTDRTVFFACQRQSGVTVKREIESGSCAVPEYDFVKDDQTGSCVAARCPGPHNLGTDWSMDTTDKLGSYRLLCVLQEGRPIPIFKENSGSCLNPNKYDFVTTSKSCALVRCQNRKALNSSWFEDAPSTPNATQEYTCTSAGDIVEKGSFACKNGFLKRGSQCSIACDIANNHAVGDSAWPADNGKFVCDGASVMLSSCNDNYLPRNGFCKKSCGGDHAVDDPAWTEKNGTYRCQDASPVLVSCNSGFISINGSCKRDCGSGHIEGTDTGTWVEGIGANYRWTCDAGGAHKGEFVNCDPGYMQDGTTCKLLPPDPIIECHVGEHHCIGAKFYTCNNGKWAPSPGGQCTPPGGRG